jgi:hypothetical protein
LQEEDVENDEKKKNRETSSVRSQQQKINPFKKSYMRQTQTKNKEFAKSRWF